MHVSACMHLRRPYNRNACMQASMYATEVPVHRKMHACMNKRGGKYTGTGCMHACMHAGGVSVHRKCMHPRVNACMHAVEVSVHLNTRFPASCHRAVWVSVHLVESSSFVDFLVFFRSLSLFFVFSPFFLFKTPQSPQTFR